MRNLSKAFLGVACLGLLCSCGAKKISGGEALSIAEKNWSVETAQAKYVGYKLTTKDSKGTNTVEERDPDAVKSTIATLIPANTGFLSTIVLIELVYPQNVGVYANGSALEFRWTADGATSEYHTNDLGLTTYSKVTSTYNGETSTSESWYTWYTA